MEATVCCITAASWPLEITDERQHSWFDRSRRNCQRCRCYNVDVLWKVDGSCRTYEQALVKELILRWCCSSMIMSRKPLDSCSTRLMKAYFDNQVLFPRSVSIRPGGRRYSEHVRLIALTGSTTVERSPQRTQTLVLQACE